MAIPQVKVPKYTLVLPSTGEKVQYRPFVMKEEKILLMAQEGTEQDIVDAIDEVITGCTDGNVSTKTHPLFDIQYVFLQIRAKSVGEIAEFEMICGECSGRLPASLNIAELQVERTEGHRDTIMVTEDVGVKMRYPRLEHLAALEDSEDIESIYRVVASCVAAIFSDEEAHTCTDESLPDVLEFLDTLTTEQFIKIRSFFDTMPKMVHTIEYKCPKCETQNELVIAGLTGFFG